MKDQINPNPLPDWPWKDRQAEEKTILSCLLGKDGKQEFTSNFGYMMLYWEGFRHVKELAENFRSFHLHAPASWIANTPGWSDTPFMDLRTVDRNELIELHTPGQRAFEVQDIRMLDALGVLDQFKKFAEKANQQRRKDPAILKRERLNLGEEIYNFLGTARFHLGEAALRRDFDRWIIENRYRIPDVTSAKFQRKNDPRPLLRDLAVLRLVFLFGYDGADRWTKDNCVRAMEC